MKAALSFHPIAGDYDFIGEFREGRALVRNNIAEFRVGYIDKEGRVAVPLEYIGRFEREAGHPVFVHFPFFSDGLAVLMRKDGRFGAVDPSGGMAVPFIYDSLTYFYGGLVEAQKDGKWGFLDKEGHAAIPLLYDRVGTFSEGLAAIKRDGAYGYADKTGQVVIPCAYSAAGGFHEGYAAVRKDGRYGYIDRTGATVVPFIYDTAARFCDGAAAVRKDGGWGIWQIETRGG